MITQQQALAGLGQLELEAVLAAGENENLPLPSFSSLAPLDFRAPTSAALGRDAKLKPRS